MRMLYYIICIYTYFFPVTSGHLLFEIGQSHGGLRFEVEEPPSRKQSNGESRPSVAWHAGNLMVDLIFTHADISGTQGHSQTPRSIAAGWSLLECCIAFSIFAFWQIVDGVTSLKKDRVLQLLIINTLAAWQQGGQVTRFIDVLFFMPPAQVTNVPDSEWNDASQQDDCKELEHSFFSFQDEWKVTSATWCAEVFLYPLNSVHFPVLFKQPHWHVCDAKQQHPPPLVPWFFILSGWRSVLKNQS